MHGKLSWFLSSVDYLEDLTNMSAHVLLNLLNQLRKRDKMQGLPSILSLFLNEFNKFNYRSMNVRFYLLNEIQIT